MMICQWCRWLFLLCYLLASTTTIIQRTCAFSSIINSATQSRRIHGIIPSKRPLHYILDNDNNSDTLPKNNNRRPLHTSSNNNNKNDEARRFFRGAPSTPGFKPGQFEKLTQWAISTSSNRPVVAEYDPDGLWLWTRWDGTIRQMTYRNVLFILLWALLVDLYAYYHYTLYLIATAAVNGGDVTSLIDNLTWISFEIPHSKDPIIDTLSAINGLWEYQLSLTIFTLSFFVNHAYTQWRMTYFCTRAIQGRINGLCMLVTSGARRSAGFGEVEGTTGYQRCEQEGGLGGGLWADHHGAGGATAIGGRETTAAAAAEDKPKNNRRDARKLVDDVTRYLRMSHTFFWASTPTHSDGFGDTHHSEGGILGDVELKDRNFDASQFGPMLLSAEGLDMLVDYEQLTQREKEALVATGLPPSQYSYVMLEWAGIRCIDGMEHGELRGSPAMEDNILRLLNELRAEYFNIGDYNAGRMPMAYVQVMEVFVDTLTVLAPLALYTKMGTFNIISSGLLTLFFKGLLELSKSFLDPFGREGYRAHNIRVDVLVSELNFGASSRWIDAGDALPSEVLISDNDDDDDKNAVDEVVASPTTTTTTISAPFVANNHKQPSPPPVVAMETDERRVQENYDKLGKMTREMGASIANNEEYVNGVLKDSPPF